MNPAAPVTSNFNAIPSSAGLQATVRLRHRQHVLDVEDHDVRAAERADALGPERQKLAVRDSDDDCIIAARVRLRDHRDAVLVMRLAGVDPRIVHVDLAAEAHELLHDVGDLGIADVGAVLLEREPETQHARAGRLNVALDHQLDRARRDVLGHAVVQTPAREDDLRTVPDLLGLVREVVRVDADAVAAHETGREPQKIPLRARRLEHFLRVDAEPSEDHRELVHQRDVDVALRVLDDLGGFGYAQRRRLVRAGRDDAAVERVDVVGDLRRGPRRHLLDRRQPMFLVAGVDALGAVAREEVLVELEARPLLEDRDAVLLRAPGIHGGLVDDHVALLEHAAHGLAGALERAQHGPVVLPDRRRHGHDERVALLQVVLVGGERELLRGDELLGRGLERRVAARSQLFDPGRLDVEPDGRKLFAELDGKRQADVAQADDSDLTWCRIFRTITLVGVSTTQQELERNTDYSVYIGIYVIGWLVVPLFY